MLAGMVSGRAWAALFVSMHFVAAPALAKPDLLQVDIVAGPLPDCLQVLQRQTGIELLYDQSLVSGLQSPSVRGSLTADRALQQLLAETDLTARRAESGAWIVEQPAAAPLARQDAAVPEILVVGQNSRNADIRRFESDVQPYTVATQADIARAHRDNLDQFFNSRITQNTTVVPPTLGQEGYTVSEINLRGLGPENTLVLVDGRRMPGIPGAGSGFEQTDVTAIPLHAIQRVEVLTGAAGGIHGLGALGGVVNVVLDRDDRGLELFATGGIDSRGDGSRHGLELSYGHSWRDGRTALSLFASHEESDTPLVGDRNYDVRDRRRVAELAPDQYPAPTFHGNSVSVREGSSNLQLKPAFGGTPLPSSFTYLPAGFAGDARQLGDSLLMHAGQLDFSLPDDRARSDLGTNPRNRSLIANFSHQFDSGLEAYADILMLDTRGELTRRNSSGVAYIAANSPANPFSNFITVDFPIEGMKNDSSAHTENHRYSAGVLAELPHDWRGAVEASYGNFRFAQEGSFDIAPHGFLLLGGAASDLNTNPFGNWQDFQQAITADLAHATVTLDADSIFRDASLRLAGPVFETAAGPALLTLLAEYRTDDLFTAEESEFAQSGMPPPVPDHHVLPTRSRDTQSLYAELQPRVFGEQAPVALLRQLELQFAARRDDQEFDLVRDDLDPDSARFHPRFVATSYTAGAKVTPWPWLMLRSSYATGEQPPSPDALHENDDQNTRFSANDPKRGNMPVAAGGPILLKTGGYAGLKTAQATTLSFGTAITPFGEDGVRFGIDYSRIRLGQLVSVLLPAFVIAHEDYWPQRVGRAPLTDADRALGYEAGPITMVDSRYSNGGSLEVESIDSHLEWPVPLVDSRLRLYAEATYHMKNRSHDQFVPGVESAGIFGGPLKWRANGGFDWSTERLTIGANLQYYSRSQLRSDIEAQGSKYIASQAYLDLHASWRPPVPHDALLIDFGAVNVLDRAPPRETALISGGPGYSRYGDPRQRRFELVLSFHF